MSTGPFRQSRIRGIERRRTFAACLVSACVCADRGVAALFAVCVREKGFGWGKRRSKASPGILSFIYCHSRCRRSVTAAGNEIDERLCPCVSLSTVATYFFIPTLAFFYFLC
jgi:hypothetical protein